MPASRQTPKHDMEYSMGYHVVDEIEYDSHDGHGSGYVDDDEAWYGSGGSKSGKGSASKGSKGSVSKSGEGYYGGSKSGKAGSSWWSAESSDHDGGWWSGGGGSSGKSGKGRRVRM